MPAAPPGTSRPPAPQPPDLGTELPAPDLLEFAARYAAFGYEDPGDQLLALACDVTRLYAETQRAGGADARYAAGDFLDTVAGNIIDAGPDPA